MDRADAAVVVHPGLRRTAMTVTLQPLRTPAFDWDEARRLRAAGLTYTEIGRRFGVTGWAVSRVCNITALDRSRAASSEWNAAHNHRYKTLCGCGRAMRWHDHACRRCVAERMTESVAATTLRCSSCREWKPDDLFTPRYRNTARRGRHQECRACAASRRRAERARKRQAA